ncbi:MAG TPA: ribose 5-phosphate isomerase B [Candidatus Eremiobacteraeota bacterium]|nr:MAG: putative sugar phosphate isomerase YwlF [bacterium ADurb.Bin363]HPZ09884.1 ribose 5-phosphate isomerase B [Candidatus Eremiobacteraeota bacterium]
MKIIIGSDHGGFDLKEILKKFIKELGHEVLDYGTYSKDPVDYPDIAFLVADMVSKDPVSLGIIIDGAGCGSAITANKVPGIRASACYDCFTAWNSRAHNDANILTLGSRVTGEELVKRIVSTWIATEFEGGRHMRRVAKIMDVERKFLQKRQV